MRLRAGQIDAIRDVVRQEPGPGARVRLFGSRLDDDRRGGDVDLFVELDDLVSSPAWLSARRSAPLSRAMHGRKIDVALSARNLQRGATHAVAEREGRVP